MAGFRLAAWRLWAVPLALVPLIYNPISYWQFEPNKAALLVAVAGVLIGCFLWQGTIYRINISSTERWIAGFWLVSMAATAASILPHWSLWGTSLWRNGLLMWIVAGLLFMLIRRQLITPQQRWFVVDVIIAASIPMAFSGLLEQFDYASWIIDRNSDRATSTFGYESLLALYLAMVLPLTVARLLTTRRQIALLPTLGLQIATLLVTYSRSGWLAAGIGLGVMVVGWLWSSNRHQIAFGLMAASIVTLVVLVMLSLLPPLDDDAPLILRTLTSMFRWTGATEKARLWGWGTALEAWGNRPLLGYGPATFGVVAEWFAPPKFAYLGGVQILGGNVHNFYLQIAVDSGLVGLVIYTGLLVSLFRGVVQRLHTAENDERLLLAAIGGALVANLVGNGFSFDSIATLMLFWTLAGVSHKPEINTQYTRYMPQRTIGGLVGLSGLLLGLWLVLPGMLAYHFQHLPTATQWSPTPEVLQIEWGRQNALVGDWQVGADRYEHLVSAFPTVTNLRRQQGLFLRRWYLATRDVTVAEQAIAAYTHALALSPANPDLWLDRGQIYMDIHDFEKALADFEKANELLHDYGRYYGVMTGYAIQQGDLEAAAQWEQKAVSARQMSDDLWWR